MSVDRLCWPHAHITVVQQFFLDVFGRSQLDDTDRAEIIATCDEILQRDDGDVNTAFIVGMARVADRRC